MGHLDSHVIFDRALFARQSCAVGKRIPLRLQRASYRANNWVTTAQNWCRGSATEIGRKTAKTARDAKMFDATECWEYVATVYRDILPGKFGWIAVHWIMLESAQNWSPNGRVINSLSLFAQRQAITFIGLFIFGTRIGPNDKYRPGTIHTTPIINIIRCCIHVLPWMNVTRSSPDPPRSNLTASDEQQRNQNAVSVH